MQKELLLQVLWLQFYEHSKAAGGASPVSLKGLHTVCYINKINLAVNFYSSHLRYIFFSFTIKYMHTNNLTQFCGLTILFHYLNTVPE